MTASHQPARNDSTDGGDLRTAGDLRAAVAYAIRAPSSHNSQPWRFRLLPDGIELRADWSRLLSVVDPDGRELVMSCGAALFHLRCALAHHGHRATVAANPDSAKPELLARVRCERRECPERSASSDKSAEQPLFAAIARRQTHRKPFLTTPLPEGLMTEVTTAAETEGARLIHIDARPTRDAIAELVAEGDRLQWNDHRFRRELASWLRPNSDPRGDGLAGHTIGLGNLTSRLAPLAVRFSNLGKQQARTNSRLTVDAPALAVLTTTGDHLPHWLAAGQALAHVLLRAAARGLSAGFLNQPIQCPSLRGQLNALLPDGQIAQTVLRLGYAELGPRSQRRPLETVLD